MPQLSLYIDKPLYMELKARAKETGETLSGINKKALENYLHGSWPEGFLDKYYGMFEDDPIEVPEEIPWELNIKREEI